MASVLPMDDPRMSIDDLSSPTWRIIFLKDDCFLQPSCEVTTSSSDPDSLANSIISATTTHHHHYEEETDSHTIPSSPSSMIEPLFDEIDLNHQHQQNHQTQRLNFTCTESIGRTSGSPSLSRSSSLSLSDDDDDDQVRNRSPQPRGSPKIIQQQQQQRKRKRPSQKKIGQKQQRTQKRYKQHDTTAISTTTVTSITNTSAATTLFEQLSFDGINWCRYCGTTEGVNWRPGPWGKRTLCNKHGCDFKGYGLASRLPRLDLSSYRHELIEDRHRPVIQEFCSICQERGGHQHQLKHSQRRNPQSQSKRSISTTEKGDDDDDNDHDSSEELVACDGGCSRAFHRHCFVTDKEDGNGSAAWVDQLDKSSLWFCSPSCSENRRKKRVVVDLPRKQPLMRPLKKE
ncbi:hypothetical protein BCR42DRAFT_399905 [Absidia repens]|uniref:Zinc finger PHD-type domain-containing protein n=1 Tax=Absidia repens TaxID=90262 RepID=A0A1X2J0G1_9FUNG|nr:hypothetical protein BCR42DRAFT_399905 [Absidia repens]